MRVQRQNIEAMLKSMLSQYDETPIPDDLDLTDLLDSISFVSMIITLEQEYDISIPHHDLFIDKFNTISKIAESVERYQNNKISQNS